MRFQSIGNKINIKYAIVKKMKTRSIKTKRPLIEHNTVTDNNLKPTGNPFLPVFAETAPEVQRKKIKELRSSKINRYFLKTNIFKVITDIR